MFQHTKTNYATVDKPYKAYVTENATDSSEATTKIVTLTKTITVRSLQYGNGINVLG